MLSCIRDEVTQGDNLVLTYRNSTAKGEKMFYSIPQTKMLSSAQNSLSPSSKPRSIFVEMMIFLLVFMISSLPQSFISSISTSVMMFLDPGYYELINSFSETGVMDYNAITQFVVDFMSDIPSEIYIPILASSGFFILGSIIYCKAFEKRSPFSMGFNKRGILPEYLTGLGVGAVMISLPVLFCVLTGAVSLNVADGINPLTIILFFLAFMLQGMGEEALFRGYLLTSLSRRTNTWIAIIISSVMFSVMHIANANFGIIPFINITLFGIFAAVYMLKRGSIWGVGAIHTVWNFMQGNIYGFSVSGNPKFNTVFDCNLGEFGSILSGGEFGIEGGLGATIVLLIALVVALAMPAKKSELDIPQTEQA